MKPRTKPQSTTESSEVIAELKNYGSLQKHKLGMANVIVFWQDHGRPLGLPATWTHDGLVSDEMKSNWRIYLRKMSGLYMGFCESTDGTVLRLLMIVPVEEMTRSNALMTIRERV